MTSEKAFSVFRRQNERFTTLHRAVKFRGPLLAAVAIRLLANSRCWFNKVSLFRFSQFPFA